MTDSRSPRVQPLDEDVLVPSRPGRTNRLVGIAVVLAVAVLALLFSLTDRPEEATDTQSLPTVPVTTVPLLVEPVVGVDGPPDLVTSLGRLTWSRVLADDAGLPFGGFQFDPVRGDYVGYGGDDVLLRSDDGLVWAADTSGSRFAPGSSVQYFSGLALVNAVGGFEVYEPDDGQWAQVPISDLSHGGVTGLRWVSWAGRPVESHGVLVIPVTVHAVLPLEVIYPAPASGDCLHFGFCQTSMWVQWSGFSETFTVYTDEAVVAVLTFETVGGEVRLIDEGTGETVYVVTFPDETAANAYLDDLNSGASVSKQVVYVRDGEGPFETYDARWDDEVILGSVPGGFVAYESIEYPAGTLQGFPMTWISADGFDWTQAGSPGFLPERYEEATVSFLNDELVARVVLSRGLSGEQDVEEWVTTDGVEWTQREPTLPGDVWMETNFGFTATGYAFRPRLWISASGENWEEIALPEPEIPESVFSYGGAGDLLYYSTWRPPESFGLSFWIGQFAN